MIWNTSSILWIIFEFLRQKPKGYFSRKYCYIITYFLSNIIFVCIHIQCIFIKSRDWINKGHMQFCKHYYFRIVLILSAQHKKSVLICLWSYCNQLKVPLTVLYVGLLSIKHQKEREWERERKRERERGSGPLRLDFPSVLGCCVGR